MKTTTLGRIGLAVALLAATGATAWVATQDGPLPPLPTSPRAVQDVLVASPFVLEQPYIHTWRSDEPEVRAGYLLVLAVDADLARRRESLEPVLYVGEQTAERINHATSGRLVVLVPAATGPDGLPKLDLATTPMWFGTPELPERIDGARIQSELAHARAARIAPPSFARVAAARALGGEPLRLTDAHALRLRAAELVLEYAPDEQDLARGLMAPRLR